MLSCSWLMRSIKTSLTLSSGENKALSTLLSLIIVLARSRPGNKNLLATNNNIAATIAMLIALIIFFIETPFLIRLHQIVYCIVLGFVFQFWIVVQEILFFYINYTLLGIFLLICDLLLIFSL